MSRDVILVPLKRFDIAKDRLRQSGVSDATNVARRLAIEVLHACVPRDVIVIGECEEIAAFAREQLAESFDSNATDLNEAVSRAYQFAGERYNRVFIVHGDLREPIGLGTFTPNEGISIFTDHHGTGTNVLILPTGLDFRFGYGPRSAQHHLNEARRLRTVSSLVTDSPWRFDVDELDDLI
jgi:2-phospho-L-lactate guanylyltransferase (CobY/MobA/RfbA family)